MDRRADIRDYLISRRAKITPDQAGLYRSEGDIRRVPGLRREEVARLAGVSLDYYTELERGDLDRASDAVLDAIARALQLDQAERAHLFDLARPAGALGLPASGDQFSSITPGTVWGDRYNTSVTVTGDSDWTVTIAITAPQRVSTTWSATFSWTNSGYTMTVRPNGSGNSFGFTTMTNGNSSARPQIL